MPGEVRLLGIDRQGKGQAKGGKVRQGYDRRPSIEVKKENEAFAFALLFARWGAPEVGA